MRLLDLFCCAGGAGKGYADTGFEVVGVDIRPQPRYPFEFIQADVLGLDPAFVRSFDAIHASPPCQGYTALRHAPGTKGAPQLIDAVRDMLEASSRPYVIENVEDARGAMRAPVTLCGSSFGLGWQEGETWFELQRHRLFEANWPLVAPACQHSGAPVIGVYGGHARNRSAIHGGRGTRDVWTGGHKAAAKTAMGMPWATLEEVSEAIPPTYTRVIGRQLRAHLEREHRTAA